MDMPGRGIRGRTVDGGRWMVDGERVAKYLFICNEERVMKMINICMHIFIT